MKKVLVYLMLLLIPINVFAYSDKIIPGGNNIGIEINSNGVLVIGFYKINNRFNRNDLKVGDAIVKVANNEINSIDDLVREIEKNAVNEIVTLTVKRNNKEIDKDFKLVSVDGKLKTGLYVKDSITGIGTLSYIDPQTKIYGALGHEIIESTSGNLIEVKTGSIFRSSVTSIDPSIRGTAGTKNAKFYSNMVFGNIIKNSNKGIYGIYSANLDSEELLEVGTYQDISLGKAYIRTVTSGEKIENYEIEIDRVNNNETKNIHFQIKSGELLKKAGGIVQGMSGSPIIQNNKIIGAVTHVIVDNPETGYGILITNMLEEGEKNN